MEMVPRESLLDKVQGFRKQGYRPVQISATRLAEQLELTYSFDCHGTLANIRVLVPLTDLRVASISSIFGCVIFYENELHDLFNLRVEGMAVDFHGHLYQTAVKFPFAVARTPAKAATAKPAAASAPAARSSPPPDAP